MTRRLRIAFWNLQAGVATTRGYWQYISTAWKYILPHGSRAVERAGKALGDEAVDVAAVCEIDGGSWRTRGIDQVALLARAAGLEHRAFFPAFVVGSRVLQGNGICASFPVRPRASHPLPGTGEPRFLNEAEVQIGGRAVRFFITHLSLQYKIRASQIAAIAEILAGSEGPLVLAGDFNISSTKELRLLRQSPLDKALSRPTFPSWRPVHHLDHLFFSREFRIVEGRSSSLPRCSDHVPIVAEVELDSGGSGGRTRPSTDSAPS